MSDATPLTVPPAGWYPDRNAANTLRWWDGGQWTDHTHSVAPEQAVEQPVSAAAFGFASVEPNPVVADGLPAVSIAAPAVAAQIPPGWYPDNADRTIQRWWDGTQWTAHTAPSATGASVPAAAPAVASTHNTMATVSLILALGSFAGLIFAPLLVLAVSGIFIGIVALLRVPRYAPNGGRRGQAIAGIVVGAVSMITTVLLAVAAVGVYQQVHQPGSGPTQQSEPGSGSDSSGSGVFFPSTVSDLKSSIATSIQRQYTVTVTTVTCDADASMIAGSRFQCGVIVDDGRWDAIQVQIGKAAESGMAFDLGYGPLLSSSSTAASPPYTVDSIKQELAESLKQAWDAPVSGVTCDPSASDARGATFGCLISLADGRAGQVTITIVDPGGYDVKVARAPGGPGGSGGSSGSDLSSS